MLNILRIGVVVLTVVWGLAGAAQQSSVTQYGITWTFSQAREVGQYCNGDYWVVGPVNITSITNSWHTHGFTPGKGQDGSMINPGGGGNQGYDSTLTSYQANLNAALIGGNRISSSNPLMLTTNSSLVSSVSWLYTSDSTTEPGCPTFNGGTHTPRPVLRDAAILTCVATAPATGSFRPPYCGNDKAAKFNTNQLDYTLLNNFIPPASTPSLATIQRSVERPWIDHVYQYSGAFLHPSENMPQYGEDVSIAMGKAALMLHLDFSQLPGSPSKDTLLVRMVQLGIDLAGIADVGGGWPANGGHHMGRKWPILFAGLVLHDAHMDSVGSWNTRFQENENTYYVDQAAVDMTHSAAWAPDSRAPALAYEIKDIGLPEWGIVHAASPSADNLHWSATYRSINNDAYAGFVLAAQVMGAKTLWSHNAIFDYIDRSTHFGSAGYPPSHRYYALYTFGSTFVYDLWQAQRSKYGCTWVPTTDTVYSNGTTDCSRCVYYCPSRISHSVQPQDNPRHFTVTNPVVRYLTIPAEAGSVMRILDANGRTAALPGPRDIFDLGALPAGVYYLDAGQNRIQSIVIIK
jgi:hypothetical protein